MLWGAEARVEIRAAEHVHGDHELVIALADTGAQWVGPRAYPSRRGQAWFLPSRVAHGAAGQPGAPMALFYVCFAPGWFADHGQPEVEALVRGWTVAGCYQPTLGHGARQQLLALEQGLLHELRQPGSMGQAMAHALLTQMLVLIAREQDAPTAARSPRAEQFDALADAVEAEPARALSVDAVARQVGMSRSSFTQAWRQYAGTSWVGFVQAARLGEARRRLATTDAAVSEVATACGFTNLGHFHELFRRAVGTTPLRFRRQAEQLGGYHVFGLTAALPEPD